MRIAIDISQIVYGTGVSVYTKNLVENLLNLDRKNEYILFAGVLRKRQDIKRFVRNLKGNYKTKILPIPPKLSDILFNKIHFVGIEKFIGKQDVFHSSDWTQPSYDGFKVTTVHDLSPLLFPKSTPKNIYSAHKDRIKWVLKEVDRIIVPSGQTKKDLVKIGADEKIIRVIHEGVSDIFRKYPNFQIEKVKKNLRVRGKYIISVGISQRKNTKRLIEAYELARAGQDIDLVLVGDPKISLPQTRGVNILGHVSDLELASLMSGAECLIYPSLYEGFGLPILEAFACGCAVVTSNYGSMKEVASDAAVLVNPQSTESIVEGIKMALKNKKDLIRKGRRRVKDFSWRKTAEETLKVYQEADVN